MFTYKVEPTQRPSRTYFTPFFPIREANKTTETFEPVSTNDNHRLTQDINSKQQIVLQYWNSLVDKMPISKALEEVMNNDISNSVECAQQIRMLLLTLLAYEQITPEECVSCLAKLKERIKK